MTRHELYTEIKRIDGFIEVLQNLLSAPLCTCITETKKCSENFTRENKKDLQLLLGIRNSLQLLKEKPDTMLEKITYRPVHFKC